MEPIGILDLDIYVPPIRMSAEDMAAALGGSVSEIVQQTGVLEKAVGLPEDTPTVMAVKAAKPLIQRGRTLPHDISYVIFAGSGVNEKRFWSPAAKVQAELGANRAFAFDVANGCNAGNIGLTLAAGLLRADSHAQTALLIVSDALSCLVNYNNPCHTPLFNFADAAASVLIGKGAEQLRLLSFAAITQPEFVDCLSLSAADRHLTRSMDPETRERLRQAYRRNYTRTIRDACERAGIQPIALRRLFINQGDHRLIDTIASDLGLPGDVPFKSFERMGHLGGVDVFFGLRACLASSELRRGDLIALATSAIGFSWGCTIIRV